MRGKTTHVLSEVDRDARTAYCDHCGKVKVYFNSKNGSAQCAEASKARAKAKRKLRPLKKPIQLKLWEE